MPDSFGMFELLATLTYWVLKIKEGGIPFRKAS
jgi:hypothetical protein